MGAIVVALLTLLGLSALFFGDPLALPGILLYYHTSQMVWLMISAGLAAGVVIHWWLFRTALIRNRLVNATAIVALPFLTTVSVTAIAATQMRTAEIARFQPDHIQTENFLASMRSAPRDFQFFLHAAALKDCVAYGWSYREMQFYRIPDRALANVLPKEFYEICPLDRKAT